jgi:hypothetical protein
MNAQFFCLKRNKLKEKRWPNLMQQLQEAPPQEDRLTSRKQAITGNINIFLEKKMKKKLEIQNAS